MKVLRWKEMIWTIQSPSTNKSVKIRREMKNKASGQMEMKIDTNKEPIQWGKRKRERER